MIVSEDEIAILGNLESESADFFLIQLAIFKRCSPVDKREVRWLGSGAGGLFIFRFDKVFQDRIFSLKGGKFVFSPPKGGR